MSHDDTMKWAEVEFETPQPNFEQTVEGEAWVVRGKCPRCHGKTAWSFRRGQMGSMREEMMDKMASGDPATIICACGFPHDQRPDDAGESGCGAFWPVCLK